MPEPVLVAAWTALWLAATAWARPLMLPDEGRYAGVAWEMLHSGDWLTPTLNGLPFFHKPPLFYWITASSLATFGMNAWAARAAPLLGGFAAAFSLYLFARRWTGRATARATLVALVVQPLFFAGAQFANLDMLVAGCITATVLLLAHAALCLESGLPHRRALLAAYAVAALGMLAKGLIGAVLPALIVASWLVARRAWRTLARLVSLPGLALFLALALPWFLAMQSRFPSFFDYFFLVQHFQRFVGGGFNNAQPFWFYPVALAVLGLPWLPWLYRRVRLGSPAMPAAAGAISALAWIWFALVVLFFSLPQSKLIGYVLPAVPPLALLLAQARRGGAEEAPRLRRRWATSVVASGAVSIAAVAYFALQPTWSTRELAAALRASHGSNEPVFMIEHYYYDVPFLAQLRRPVMVVDDWTSREVFKRDNWRKELADASRFAPAAKVLVQRESFARELCAARVSWVMGASSALAAYPFLAHARPVATRRSTTLWRVDVSLPEAGRALGCPEETPPPDVRSLPPVAAVPAPAEGAGAAPPRRRRG